MKMERRAMDLGSVMKNKNLNPREKELMELIWSSAVPLTSIEMLDQLDPEKWNKLSVFRTINSLTAKKYIRVDGFEQYNTQYARKFTFSISREEYMAKLMREDGMGIESLGRVAVALLGEDSDSDENSRDALIESLQEIIDKLKEENEDKAGD